MRGSPTSRVLTGNASFGGRDTPILRSSMSPRPSGRTSTGSVPVLAFSSFETKRETESQNFGRRPQDAGIFTGSASVRPERWGPGQADHHGRTDRLRAPQEGYPARSRDARRDRGNRVPVRAGRRGDHSRPLPRRPGAAHLALRNLSGDRGQNPPADEVSRHDIHERDCGDDGRGTRRAAPGAAGGGQSHHKGAVFGPAAA